MHMSQATVVICIVGAVWRRAAQRASDDLVSAARAVRAAGAADGPGKRRAPAAGHVVEGDHRAGAGALDQWPARRGAWWRAAAAAAAARELAVRGVTNR
jgi:hypothetical protein